MNAGPALDALVAKHVMGCNVVPDPNGIAHFRCACRDAVTFDPFNAETFPPHGVWDLGEVGDCGLIPYSSSWDAMRLVVEAMAGVEAFTLIRATETDWPADTPREPPWGAQFETSSGGLGNATADTAPLAVSLAAADTKPQLWVPA